MSGVRTRDRQPIPATKKPQTAELARSSGEKRSPGDHKIPRLHRGGGLWGFLVGGGKTTKRPQSPEAAEDRGDYLAPAREKDPQRRGRGAHWGFFAAAKRLGGEGVGAKRPGGEGVGPQERAAGKRVARNRPGGNRLGEQERIPGQRIPGQRDPRRSVAPKTVARLLPVTLAAALAAAYVVASPPSLDLAAHLFRAHLFARNPFGIWNNYWYDGHHIVGYSLLFPAVSALFTPQIAAALAATATAALFEPLARRHFGQYSLLGSTLFAAATAINLFTGRLAFAFGALPALAAITALDRRRTPLACLLALITALSSPVAALFVAIVAGAYALGGFWADKEPKRVLPGVATALAALIPVVFLALAFPEGGVEPFAFSAFWPIPLVAAGALLVTPGKRPMLKAGIALYALATTASYLIPSAVGSNAARLGTWLAAPLAALILWRRKPVLLAVIALPLLYLGWHAPIRDLVTANSDPSNTAGYYEPLINFLARQPGQPFRVEVPFTSFHWEAYALASRFPIARGWERQLDIKDNPLFYDPKLAAKSYERWLHLNAVRYVAVASAPTDYAGRAEKRLIAGGLGYLHEVMHTATWHVYAVANPTPIAQGAATLTRLGPDWLTLSARRPGTVFLHVHFTPYWEITSGSGCVEPAGGFTRLILRKPGTIKLQTVFSFARINATSPRCT